MSDKIALLQPNKSPLILLTKSSQQDQPLIRSTAGWKMTCRGVLLKLTMLQVMVISDTQFTVDDASIFNVGDIVLIPSSGETMRVTEVTDTTDG